MGSRSIGRVILVVSLFLLFPCALSPVVDAQGLAQFPGHSNPLALPGRPVDSEAMPVPSGMLAPFLPKIRSLELGFLYSFGNHVRTGRFTADYVLPIRRMLGEGTFLGVNGFYDTSRLFDKWYSSGGAVLEMGANIPGDDAIDLNFNWYGNLFNRNVLVNALRNKGNSFDVEAGYSHSLFNQALDLRLKAIGYQFDVGTPIRGWRGGADLTTRNGVFTLRYEHGHHYRYRNAARGDGDRTIGIRGYVWSGSHAAKGEALFYECSAPSLRSLVCHV